MFSHLQCGLIGHPLGHSYSPEIHELLGNYQYKLYDLSEEELPQFINSRCFDGINVTIPYKKTVMPYLDEITSEATRIGSVNTIIKDNTGKLIGYNTDYSGFREMIRPYENACRGKKVLVLGSGGSSVTVQTVLADLGVGQCVVVSRSGPDNYQNLDRHLDASMIINTTPVGMFPHNGEAPLAVKNFTRLEAVLDLIYNPNKTALILDAEELHIPAETGLTMLVAQAIAASTLFTGQPHDSPVLSRVCTAIQRKKKNIVLVGMPGCGKSTVGNILAARLERRFYDLDEEILNITGRTASDIILQEGENRFREIESECLSKVSRLSSAVIATGGGTVIRPENRRMICQNSTTVFLRRPIDELSTDRRPLSQYHSPESLWAERKQFYESVADYTIDVRPSPDLTASAIMEALTT